MQQVLPEEPVHRVLAAAPQDLRAPRVPQAVPAQAAAPQALPEFRVQRVPPELRE